MVRDFFSTIMIDRFNRDNPPDEQAAMAQDYFYRVLEDRGIDIENYVTTDDSISLTYSIVEDSPEESRKDFEWIVGAFLTIQENADLGTLEATVHGENGDEDTWHIKPEWAAKYHSGEWSGNHVVNMAKDSLEVA